MALTLKTAMAAFGSAAKPRLANVAVSGEPEEQLRTPFEALLLDMAELCGVPRKMVTCVGESALSELKTRPDFAVTKRKELVGFIEVKAPGKGADPRKYKNPHDRQQWEKLQSLPNLIYTDGNEFSLCHEGEVAAVVRVIGDIETSGKELDATGELEKLFSDFFQWRPTPPRDAKQLAYQSARLCRFLRDEVTEQLDRSPQIYAGMSGG